jgi:hypothetical protein
MAENGAMDGVRNGGISRQGGMMIDFNAAIACLTVHYLGGFSDISHFAKCFRITTRIAEWIKLSQGFMVQIISRPVQLISPNLYAILQSIK